VTPNSATQGAAIIAKPGSCSEYYIFTVDAAENDLRAGLNYSLVDRSRQAGLGEVVTVVQTSGVYWVDISSAQLCPRRDSLRLLLASTPGLTLGPDRPLGCDEILTLDATTPIAGSRYRWQDGSTQAQYRALPRPLQGEYYDPQWVHHASGGGHFTSPQPAVK